MSDISCVHFVSVRVRRSAASGSSPAWLVTSGTGAGEHTGGELQLRERTQGAVRVRPCDWTRLSASVLVLIAALPLVQEKKPTAESSCQMGILAWWRSLLSVSLTPSSMASIVRSFRRRARGEFGRTLADAPHQSHCCVFKRENIRAGSRLSGGLLEVCACRLSSCSSA